MATQPTNKTLLIPNKNALSPAGYLRDMQTLEMWARQPIQQLIAGSGITLSPTSGKGPGPITISSTGGGGGISFGYMQAFINSDPAVFSQIQGFGCDDASYSYWYLPSNPTGSDQRFSFGGMWEVQDIDPGGGPASCAIFPMFAVPTYTGGGVSIEYVVMGVFDINGNTPPPATTAGAAYGGASQGLPFSLPSGTTVQMADTDFNVLEAAGFTFTAGSGFSGNGWIGTGTQDTILASISGAITIAAGTTF